MENSTGHEACLIAIECAVKIAQSCPIPRLNWEEFQSVCQMMWAQEEELHRTHFLIDPHAKDASNEPNLLEKKACCREENCTCSYGEL